jgi:hypothetical protein
MITQLDINSHLESVGLDPTAAVWGSMLDLTYLMPEFLSRGGNYDCVAQQGWDIYPQTTMRVQYGNNSLLLNRFYSEGYPTIRITQAITQIVEDKPQYLWPMVQVHPDHLDAALCYLLQVPPHEP